MISSKFSAFLKNLRINPKGDLKMLEDYPRVLVPSEVPIIQLNLNWTESNIQADYYAQRQDDIACFTLAEDMNATKKLGSRIPNDTRARNQFIQSFYTKFMGAPVTPLKDGKSHYKYEIANKVTVNFTTSQGSTKSNTCFVVPEAMARVKNYF
jgi:hypothetical protein